MRSKARQDAYPTIVLVDRSKNKVLGRQDAYPTMVFGDVY
jgi:hypothetical protein